MRLAVTGASGFIGLNLVCGLSKKHDFQILAIDKRPFVSNQWRGASQDFSFLQLDLTNHTELSYCLNQFQPEGIIHLAAETHVDKSIDAPLSFVASNLVGTYCLLEVIRGYLAQLNKHGRSKFRLVHVSTDEVYGSLSANSPSARECDSYCPNSPYAATKAGADHLVRAWCVTYGVPGIVSHCTNNFGPFQYPEKLVPLVILRALQGEMIPVFGDGGNIRDWLHVTDHVRALTLLLLQGKPGEVYNISGQNECTNQQIVRRICSILDKLLPPASNPFLRRPLLSYSELIALVADRPGHDFRYSLDPSKLHRELGWSAEVDLAAGLQTTVAWYLNNRYWWEPLLKQDDPLRRQGLGLSLPTTKEAS